MSGSSWGQAPTQFFYDLTPDRVLDAVETQGVHCTGRCLPLGSFENRVYEIEIEWEHDEPPRTPSERFRVAKFYRPGRWTRAQIEEEHALIQALQAEEIPAVAPLTFQDGKTLAEDKHTGIFYALFPKVGGRSPDELTSEQRKRLGALLGRMHLVGAKEPFRERLTLTGVRYGRGSLEILEAEGVVPMHLESRLVQAVEVLSERYDSFFKPEQFIRLHGDCHLGNVLWNDAGPFFVDFDDAIQGPPVQDFWLLAGASDAGWSARMEELIEGYELFRTFDRQSLKAVPWLRGLRMVHHAAWIAKRWSDPAFPRVFPQFEDARYWEDLLYSIEALVRLE